MTIDYRGPSIYIHIEANELSNGHTIIQLADGYTYERIFIHYGDNIELEPFLLIRGSDDITFPVVNSKSPSILPLFILDTTKNADIRFTIEKFGQIPDPNYFNGPF